MFKFDGTRLRALRGDCFVRLPRPQRFSVDKGYLGVARQQSVCGGCGVVRLRLNSGSALSADVDRLRALRGRCPASRGKALLRGSAGNVSTAASNRCVVPRRNVQRRSSAMATSDRLRASESSAVLRDSPRTRLAPAPLLRALRGWLSRNPPDRQSRAR